MTGIGHNRPPSAAEMALDVAMEINNWLMDHPVIGDEKEAREAKPLIDRAKLTLADMEEERKGKVRPLNEQIATINGPYKRAKTTLEAICTALGDRLTQYIAAEEQRRRVEAEAARRKAEEAEAAAREAERKEREALENAKAGELDINILQATQEADESFAAYKKAERIAARAERDNVVRIGGGFSGRSLSLRSHETLTVDNWQTAITAMGLTADITEAILKSARAYRKLKGALPPGVSANKERKL